MNFFAKSCPNAPKFNRAIEKWAARDMVDSYGFATCKEAVVWYSNTAVSPTWKGFVYAADKCVKEMSIYKDDVKQRKRNRKIAQKWRAS
jgi:hypothetical protein